MVKPHNGQWRVDFSIVRDGKRERIRRVFSTQLQAVSWESWAKGRIAQGLPLEDVVATRDEDGWTMAKLCDAVHMRYWKGTANEENALRNAEECVNLLGPDRHPASITAGDLDDMMQTLISNGNSDATVNRKLAAVGKMFTHALSRGIITRRPMIEKRKESEGRLRWYTHEEEAKALAWLGENDPDLRDLVLFLADTGCRLGEAIGLTWQDVDGTYARFHGTKNGRSRAVPLTQRLKAMLAGRQGKPGDRVFAPLDGFQAIRQWNLCRKAIGLKDDPQAVLHTWRHTCASRLVQAAVPIQVVQQWLGHKSIQVTLRYAHLAPINLLQAAATLDTLTPPATDLVRLQDSGHSVSKVSIPGKQEAA